MTPVAMSLLSELRAVGLHLEQRVTGKVHVEPFAALTPARRQAILTHKAALLAALELEGRIRAMAKRWQYRPDELAWALEDAQRNPTSWLTCCALDEDLANNLNHAGMKNE